MPPSPAREMEDTPTATSPLVLVAIVLLCLGFSAIGGAITAATVDKWSPTLELPALTPPPWVFAPVWTALYVLMAVAAWRVWGQRRRVLVRPVFCLFGAQLLLNLVWTAIFFGYRDLEAALIGIFALLATVAANTVIFFRIDRLAGSLFVPYLGWTAFAAWLMLQVWKLNAS